MVKSSPLEAEGSDSGTLRLEELGKEELKFRTLRRAKELLSTFS